MSVCGTATIHHHQNTTDRTQLSREVITCRFGTHLLPLWGGTLMLPGVNPNPPPSLWPTCTCDHKPISPINSIGWPHFCLSDEAARLLRILSTSGTLMRASGTELLPQNSKGTGAVFDTTEILKLDRSIDWYAVAVLRRHAVTSWLLSSLQSFVCTRLC